MVLKNLLGIFLLLALIYPAYGMNLSISPENPYVGDDLTLKGDAASANQTLLPTVTFEKTVTVINGIYDYNLPGIKIPSGENNFVVTSKNVKDLYVGVVLLITWSKSVTADGNNTATISQSNVPSGTHNIRIYGNAAPGATSVPLTITASTKINADAQGNFSSIYSTSGIPAGTFNLTVGTITRTITLRERPTSSTDPDSSGTGTYPTITQTTPRPTSTPVVIPTEAVISGTPETTSTPVETAGSISTPKANDTEPKSTTTPGFEIGFAFSAIALLVLLKRKIV